MEKIRIKISSDKTLTSILIKHYLDNGADASFYKKKREVLSKMYGSKSVYVDCVTNINAILEQMSKEIFYSFRRDPKCNCSVNLDRKYIYIPINISFLELNGIQNLEYAVEDIHCKCIHNSYEITNMIFFEIIYLKKEHYILNKIPKCITVQNSQFTLKSFINYINPPKDLKNAIGHYQAFNLRPDSQFQIYDNASKHCKTVSSETEVKPEILIYIKD